MSKPDTPSIQDLLWGARILIVDDCRSFRNQSVADLTEAGFRSVKAVAEPESGHGLLRDHGADLVLMDIHLGGRRSLDGLSVVRDLLDAGFKGRVAVVSCEESLDQFYRSLAAGAHDYWYKGRHLNIVAEVVGLMTRAPTDPMAPWEPRNIGRLGYFRTRGLSEPSTKALLEYARDFARYREIADRMKRSPKQFKKTIADAQAHLGIRTQGQLARFLTSCEMMGRRPYRRSCEENLRGKE